MSLERIIEENQNRFRTLAFWSWDGLLEEKRIVSQISDMAENKYGGFIIHARSGLLTGYLSDEWMDMVGVAVNEAKKYGMRVFIYDEFGWPSGFVGGKLLEKEEYRAKFFRCRVSEKWESAQFSYALSTDGYVRVTEQTDSADKYFFADIVTDISNTDILKYEVTDEFIRQTHEKYYERFAPLFGNGIEGFFTDEPQYYRYATPYSSCIEERMREDFGIELFGKLPELFLNIGDYKRTRYCFYKTLHERYVDSFIKRIFNWCKAHGVKCTGHTIEESRMFTQMWCCGGAMPFYEYEDIPCVDSLCRAIDAENTSKQAGSVAAQLGMREVLTESFACTGWDVSLSELKAIAENQYVGGVNMLTEHLYHYSFVGNRKYDHPTCFSPQVPWFYEFGKFNEYFGKLGAALSAGTEYADTVVINPVHSAWTDYLREADAESVGSIDDGFLAVCGRLQQAGICHHFADESIMARYGRISGDRLEIGNCSYGYVVVPTVTTLETATVKLLKEFLGNGGRLVVDGEIAKKAGGTGEDLSFLTSNCDYGYIREREPLALLNSPEGIRQTLRETDGEKYAFFTNSAREDREIVLKSRIGVPSVLDLLTGEKTGLKAEGDTFVLNLGKWQSAFLVFDAPGVKEAAESLGTFDLPVKETGCSFNRMLLDRAKVSFDGENYTEQRPIQEIQESLIKSNYRGKLYLMFLFDARTKLEKLNLIYEKGNVRELYVNGKTVSGEPGSDISDEFYTCDISGCAVEGINRIVEVIDYCQAEESRHILYDEGVTESLKNCFCLQTELEGPILSGEFAVQSDTFRRAGEGVYLSDGDFSLSSKAVEDRRERCFFAGRITYETELPEDAEFLLTPEGRFAAINVGKDGKTVEDSSFSGKVKISGKKGDIIGIEAVSGNRNLFGPHHNVEYEPFAVCPYTFTMSGSWKDGKSADYRDSYSFVDFGITSVKAEKIR
ncbi:MAG: hypothetical protein ACI4S9_06095 [Christensenellales bacterium]